MEKLEKKFVVACVVAIMGWASNCVARQSAEFEEARARALETNLRGQETISETVERRAAQCETWLRRTDEDATRRAADLRTCAESERDLRRQLNVCNQRSDNQPPHFRATVPVEPATP